MIRTFLVKNPPLTITGIFRSVISTCAAPALRSARVFWLAPRKIEITIRREHSFIAILNPSSSIEPQYLAYNLNHQGETIFGLIQSETSNSLIMKLLDGTTRAVKRSEITSLQGTGKSIMPDGLEAGLSVQDFADLLGFLDKELRLD